MAIARSDVAGAGIQTAGLAAGGYVTAAVSNTEEYSGSTTTLNYRTLQ
jgi:hypothetical protein